MSFTTCRTNYWCEYCDHDCEDNECLTAGEAYCVEGELVGNGEYALVSTIESLSTMEIFICDNCGNVDTDGENPMRYYACDNCGSHFTDWDGAATCCYTICSAEGERDFDECHCFSVDGLGLAASGKMGISWCVDYDEDDSNLRLYICHNCHVMFFHAGSPDTITHTCKREWIDDDETSSDSPVVSRFNTSCPMCVQKQAPCLLHQPDEEDLFVSHIHL